MDVSHEKAQKQIMDFFYGEKELNEELKNHIENCEECSALWESMNLAKNLTKDELTLKEGDIQVDERIIAAAFREAEK